MYVSVHVYFCFSDCSSLIVTRDYSNTNNAATISAAASGTEFSNPRTLFVDELNYLYVGDHSNNRIVRITGATTTSNAGDFHVIPYTGSACGTFTANLMVVDSAGTLIILDVPNRHRVITLSNRGTGTCAVINPGKKTNEKEKHRQHTTNRVVIEKQQQANQQRP